MSSIDDFSEAVSAIGPTDFQDDSSVVVNSSFSSSTPFSSTTFILRIGAVISLDAVLSLGAVVSLQCASLSHNMVFGCTQTMNWSMF
jgi:hypothetical protein